MHKKRWQLICLIAALWSVGQSLPQQANAARNENKLLVGAAAGNITPRLGVFINGGMFHLKATHIHDQLYVRCIMLDNGSKRVAIVVCDSCMIPREIFDRAKRMVQENTGLPKENILMAATHTHSAASAARLFQSTPDPKYLRLLTVRIADTVRCAINNLSPGKIGWGVGEEPHQVFNRRWYMKPGTIPANPLGKLDDKVKMNPRRGSPDLIKPAGPTDPDVTVISMQSKEGRPLALLANYTLHYVGGDVRGHISADYFGMFVDRIQQLLEADRMDPPFVGMITNGASADVNNIDFRVRGKRKRPYEQMGVVADAVAAEAFRVVQKMQYLEHVALGTRQAEIQLGVRRPSKADIERAERIVAEIDGPEAKTREGVYAKEAIELSKYSDKVELIVQAMRIGDIGIVAIPCEVFVEVGLEIKKKSPFETTFIIELANGYNGYLPTVDQHKLGGYETWPARSSYLEIGAAPKIINLSLELLNDLK